MFFVVVPRQGAEKTSTLMVAKGTITSSFCGL